MQKYEILDNCVKSVFKISPLKIVMNRKYFRKMRSHFPVGKFEFMLIW